jgi:hypothetical protein
MSSGDESEFPPKVPCPGGECAYKDECSPTLSDPYGCGACCGCVGACHLEWDVQEAMTPETPAQADLRRQWERGTDGRFWRYT